MPVPLPHAVTRRGAEGLGQGAPRAQKDEGPGDAGPFVFDSVVGGTRIELVTPAV